MVPLCLNGGVKDEGGREGGRRCDVYPLLIAHTCPLVVRRRRWRTPQQRHYHDSSRASVSF